MCLSLMYLCNIYVIKNLDNVEGTFYFQCNILKNFSVVFLSLQVLPFLVIYYSISI